MDQAQPVSLFRYLFLGVWSSARFLSSLDLWGSRVGTDSVSYYSCAFKGFISYVGWVVVQQTSTATWAQFSVTNFDFEIPILQFSFNWNFQLWLAIFSSPFCTSLVGRHSILQNAHPQSKPIQGGLPLMYGGKLQNYDLGSLYQWFFFFGFLMLLS